MTFYFYLFLYTVQEKKEERQQIVNFDNITYVNKTERKSRIFVVLKFKTKYDVKTNVISNLINLLCKLLRASSINTWKCANIDELSPIYI